MTSLPFILAQAVATSAPHMAAAVKLADTAPQHWHVQLVNATVTFGLIVTTLCMFFCIYRVLIGPHIADRALAVETMGINLIALVVLLSLKFQTLIFFDGIMVLSLVGFAGGVAMAQYIGRPHMRKTKGGKAVNPTHVNTADTVDTADTDADAHNHQGPTTTTPSTDAQ